MSNRIVSCASLVIAALLLTASTAQAFVFRLVRTPLPGESKEVPGYPGQQSDPSVICPFPVPCPGTGDVVVFDLYLDTQGESDILLFSMGVVFDPTVLTYRADLSDSEHYYPLYAPGVGKQPATWLNSFGDPPLLWPDPPEGLQQVNIDFAEETFNGTTATATNLWLGRLAFQVVGSGAAIETGWHFGGNLFQTGDLQLLEPTIEIVWAPEPSTALLVGAGLAGLAGLARVRGRR